ncbi:propanediol dehydratase small subunit [Rhodoligotrophos appendicifer]|uniref:diol dehydratase small subunit n=1 Tax=Rhodoligotrophos appendicifer TaxID=987056 RepID=UPI00117EA7C4|nr:diol dehydratase small subunit [Rhodoligotrophos appendicifer]
MREKLTIRDYPIAEKRPELLEAEGGKAIADLNLEAVESGAVTMEDLRITPLALGLQAEIARDAGRPTLADNFERAAELVEVPQDFIMEVYELLRPGRAASKAPLMDAARVLREVHGARRMAAFVEEAAEVYERRGLFRYRF